MAKRRARAESAATRRPVPAAMAPLQPSGNLAAVAGSDPPPRPEMAGSAGGNIGTEDLQVAENRRDVPAEAQSEPILGRKKATMFATSQRLARHLRQA